MTIDLDSFSRDVGAKDEQWATLGIAWTFKPVSPNYGKALVSASFEALSWAGQLTVWVTGEAELETLRLSDGWVVNKHYDFATPEDLQAALDELARLVGDATVPLGAVSVPSERTQ